MSAPDGTSGSVILRNSVAGFVFFGAQMVAGVVALPIALDALGAEEFGLVSLVTGVGVFLQFVNLGLSIGLARFVGQFVATKDREELQHFVSSAYLVALLGNGFVAVGLVLLGCFGASLLDVAPGDTGTFRTVALIVAAASLVNGVLAVPRGILGGLQQTALRTRRDVIGAIGPLPAACVVALTSGDAVVYTLIWQALVVVGGLAVLEATVRTLPWLRHTPSRDASTLRRFLDFTGLQVLNQIADIIFLATDRVVLQTSLGATAVADYTIVERLQKLADYVVSIPTSAVIPAGAEAWERDARERIDTIVRTGTRLYLVAVLPPLAITAALMKPLLAAWVGDEYIRLALAAQLFILSLAGPAFLRIWAAVLVSKGRSREQVTVKLLFGPVNLASSVLLVHRLGVVGVVLPTTCYYVIIFPAVQFYLMRDEGFSVLGFIGDALPAVIAMLVVTGLVLLWQPALADDGLLGLAVCWSGITALAYGVALLTLTQSERRVVLGLARRALGR